jgi:hypothetical protein
MRKSLYTLVFKTAKGLGDVLEDIALGDGNEAIKAIYRVYYRNTTGGYGAASMAFFGCKMEGLNVSAFAALITRRAK